MEKMISTGKTLKKYQIYSGFVHVSFEMVEKPGRELNWLVKNLGYLCKLKNTFN